MINSINSDVKKMSMRKKFFIEEINIEMKEDNSKMIDSYY